MLIVINGDNKMNMKRDNVRAIRITLASHGEIVDSRKVVLFESFEYVLPHFFYNQVYFQVTSFSFMFSFQKSVFSMFKYISRLVGM